MNPTTIHKDTSFYKNLKAVAAMLEAVSPNNKTYEVEDVYFDFGQNWMWTTISRDNDKWGGVQVLNPRQWERILMADGPAELAECVEEIRNDKFFGDK